MQNQRVQQVHFLGGVMFKSKVKGLMKKSKMTMREMMEKSGVSVVTLHKARQDDRIGSCRLSTLARIGSALGVKTARLYEEVGDESPGGK